jgi:peroxiredoxin
VGVGFDEPAENQAWAEDEGFAFELWTDDDRTLAVYYGAAASADAIVPQRKTRVLGPDGTLLLQYDVSSIAPHPAQVLSDCQLLFGDE